MNECGTGLLCQACSRPSLIELFAFFRDLFHQTSPKPLSAVTTAAPMHLQVSFAGHMRTTLNPT